MKKGVRKLTEIKKEERGNSKSGKKTTNLEKQRKGKKKKVGKYN